jgi:hypothetical protein
MGTTQQKLTINFGHGSEIERDAGRIISFTWASLPMNLLEDDNLWPKISCQEENWDLTCKPLDNTSSNTNLSIINRWYHFSSHANYPHQRASNWSTSQSHQHFGDATSSSFFQRGTHPVWRVPFVSKAAVFFSNSPITSPIIDSHLPLHLLAEYKLMVLMSFLFHFEKLQH